MTDLVQVFLEGVYKTVVVVGEKSVHGLELLDAIAGRPCFAELEGPPQLVHALQHRGNCQRNATQGLNE